jgi:hypothetical protein
MLCFLSPRLLLENRFIRNAVTASMGKVIVTRPFFFGGGSIAW